MAPSAFHLPPPVLTTHEGIPYFAVHKSQLHGSPIHGVFRLDLPEQGALTLPAIPKDIFHVTVNSSQLRTTPTVPDWTYVPIHILKSRKSSTCFLLLSDLMCADLAVIDRSDQPSGHTAAARTRVKTRIQKRRTDIVRVSDFDSAGWPISSLFFFHVKCTNCREAHKKCSGVGPCERCTEKGIAALCRGGAGTNGSSQTSDAVRPSFPGYSLQPQPHPHGELFFVGF